MKLLLSARIHTPKPRITAPRTCKEKGAVSGGRSQLPLQPGRGDTGELPTSLSSQGCQGGLRPRTSSPANSSNPDSRAMSGEALLPPRVVNLSIPALGVQPVPYYLSPGPVPAWGLGASPTSQAQGGETLGGHDPQSPTHLPDLSAPRPPSAGGFLTPRQTKGPLLCGNHRGTLP